MGKEVFILLHMYTLAVQTWHHDVWLLSGLKSSSAFSNDLRKIVATSGIVDASLGFGMCSIMSVGVVFKLSNS